ncbi:MAG: hypothetical protein IID16_03515, partial [Candidatus Marinimicrobia bacterium]|nr:hypothetical protein [Candidatus Neomarinimicrobiota bacterium]
MKNNIKKLGACASLGIVILIFTSCIDTPFSPEPVAAQLVTSDQINWISWKQEVVNQIKGGKLLRGTASHIINADIGGKIGGGNTYDNMVEFPAGALEEDTYVTVDVRCVDGREQCGAGVDFLPSQEFLKDVKVTLSWEFIDYDGGELNLWVYYSGDDGGTWFKVENPEIDYDKETVA